MIRLNSNLRSGAALAGTLTGIVALGIAATITFTSCSTKQSSADLRTASGHDTGYMEAVMTPVERGKYLVTIGGCNDCHTPLKMGEHGPEPDMSRMLSGHPASVKVANAPQLDPRQWGLLGNSTNTAFVGPWGTTYSMNLTADSATGIGSWTEEQFIRTLRTGQHQGKGRVIMPPMPWQNVGKMSDDDLKAVFAFLHAIPKVNNPIQDYTPPMQTQPTTAAAPHPAHAGSKKS